MNSLTLGASDVYWKQRFLAPLAVWTSCEGSDRIASSDQTSEKSLIVTARIPIPCFSLIALQLRWCQMIIFINLSTEFGYLWVLCFKKGETKLMILMFCHKNNINKKFIRERENKCETRTIKDISRYEYLWGVMARNFLY